MCSEILRPEIRLRLHNSSHAQNTVVIAHEVHADQLTRDDERATCVELARQLCRRRVRRGGGLRKAGSGSQNGRKHSASSALCIDNGPVVRENPGSVSVRIKTLQTLRSKLLTLGCLSLLAGPAAATQFEVDEAAP